MALLTDSTIFQTAWVVPDLESAAAAWVKTHGVGPFFTMDYEGPETLQYRGRPGELRMRVAWAQAGDVQVELIQPTSESPNVYRDLVSARATGFHHVCFWSEDLPADIAAMEALGYPLAMVDNPAQPAFAYCDSSADNGHMIELLSRQAGFQPLFDAICQHAENWDGQRPLRDFSELTG